MMIFGDQTTYHNSGTVGHGIEKTMDDRTHDIAMHTDVPAHGSQEDKVENTIVIPDSQPSDEEGGQPQG